MSLQEAAPSGPFQPQPAQAHEPMTPPEAQFTQPGEEPPPVQSNAQAAQPFGDGYEYDPADHGMYPATEEERNLRAERRRAWTIVGLAIVVPAAVAGIIAWQLFGGSDAPTPTVTRVETPAVTAAAEADAASTPVVVQSSNAAVAASPTQTTAAADTASSPATTAAAASPATSSTQTAQAATTTETAQAASETSTQTAAAADLSGLDPSARLAAWTEIAQVEVEAGDSLWGIATANDTTVSAIATLNGITDTSAVYIGQVLMVPVGFAEEIAATAPAAEAAAVTESSAAADASTDAPLLAAPAELLAWETIGLVPIEEGDSLEAIAAANGTTVSAIMALNGITDPNRIFVGDVLQVPVHYASEVEGYAVTSEPVQAATDGAAASDDMLEPAAADADATGAAAGGDLMEEEAPVGGDVMEEENAGGDDMMEE